MSETPPKHAPENTDYAASEGGGQGGQLVAMYNAASHANAESFPVLKAFQDYIEAERSAARKRVMQLSVFFAVLMVVVVTGFLTAGIFMLRNMSEVQNKLLDVALAERAAPATPPAPAPVIQTSSFIEESVRQFSRATSDLQNNLDRKLEGVSEIAAKVHDRVASQDSEMEKLRDTLKQMQEQSALLQKELVTVREDQKKTTEAVAKSPPVAVPKPAPPAPATLPPTFVAAPPVATVNIPAAAKASSAPPPPAPEPPPAAVAAHAEKQQPDPRFPPAVKAPPVIPEDVTPPAAPPGMIATSIPLKTKKSGTIPWRVLMPE